MTGMANLQEILRSMAPVLVEGIFVFCTVTGDYADYAQFRPLASFEELEGLSLVLRKEAAIEGDLPFQGEFRCISLTVHSSLEAVGLTAVVAGTLADAGISANVIAGFHHDHIFVPSDHASAALRALRDLSARSA